MRLLLIGLLPFVLAAQSGISQYVMKSFAGSYPLGDGGPAASALLYEPAATAVDKKGNIYIADTWNFRVRKIDPAGMISTVAGIGTPGFPEDGEPAAKSRIGVIYAMAVDTSDNLYLGDYWQNIIWKVSAADGKISRFAGTSEYGDKGDGEAATKATFKGIVALAADSKNTVYVVDAIANRVRKISAAGTIDKFAGTGTDGFLDDVPATTAQLSEPIAIAVDSNGTVYIVDYFNARIRKVTPDGNISTLVGNGRLVGYSGENVAASNNLPVGLLSAVAVDSAGTIYYADTGRIRKIVNGMVTTAGGRGNYGYGGDGAMATAADFDLINQLHVDRAGNLLVADQYNERIRSIAPNGMVSCLAGRSHYISTGNSPASAVFFDPLGLAVDASESVYVADTDNHVVRKIANGAISTVVGDGTPGSTGDGQRASAARLSQPSGVAIDSSGKIFIADWGANRVRVIATSGEIATYAGTGDAAYNGDNRVSYTAAVDPSGIALDKDGNLYIADQTNNRVRKVTPDQVITTIAGTGTAGFSGEGVAATSARLNRPSRVAVDKSGQVYILDSSNYRIRKILANGTIVTVAGNGNAGDDGDGGLATQARIRPIDFYLDAAGNLFITSQYYGNIRMVDTKGFISTIGGAGQLPPADGVPLPSVYLDGPAALTAGPSGTMYLSTITGQQIWKLVPNTATKLEIVSGDGQTINAGGKLSLVVRLAGNLGPLVSMPVKYAITGGDATLSATDTTTDINGQAGIQLLAGAKGGAITVTATVAGLTPVTFKITAVAAAPAPSIPAGGLPTTAAPGGLVTINGANFAAAGTDRALGADDIANNRMPLTLANACVQVGTDMAPILRVTPTQIDLQIPYSAGVGTLEVRVIANCGQSNEVRSAAQMITIQPTLPELLKAVDAVTGGQITAEAPAKRGQTISVIGTGFGISDPAMENGQIPDGPANIVAAIKVQVGDVVLADEKIGYKGLMPGAIGVYRIDITLPDDTPDGDLPLVVTAGEVGTKAAVLPVKSPAGAE